MTVLSAETIKRVHNKIFEDGYKEECVDPAAYNLRINDKNLMIQGVDYDGDRTKFSDDRIRLPPKQMSCISTMEKFKLSGDYCASVGIRFSWSMKGLIPLFGPQIDPGFNDYFFAVVYNASDEEIVIQPGQGLLKMEVHPLDKPIIKPKPISVTPEYRELIRKATKTDLLKIVKDNNEDIKRISDEFKIQKDKIDDVSRGYKTVVIFGIYLLATSIIGISLSIILSNIDMSKIDNEFYEIIMSIFLGVILMIVVLISISVFIYVYRMTKNETNRG